MMGQYSKARIVLIATLVIVISILHYFTTMQQIYYHIFYRELYFLPLILAGFWFGLKGGVVTSLSITFLYLPFIVMNWQGFSPDDFDQILQVFLFITVAAGLGFISDREKAGQQALRETELLREEERKEEARVTASLANVGREMISLLDTGVILDHLCRLTAKELECDYSHTFLFKLEESAFMLVASWGDTAEQREALRVVRLPKNAVADLLTRLEKEDVVIVETPATQNLLPPVLLQALDITAVICMALRRGKEIIGLQTAGFRERITSFAAWQKRIALGMTQIASLALNNARLLEQAESASRLKTNILSVMSHELRTPLVSIIGYNDLLIDGVAGSLTEEQVDALKRIDKNSKNLLELINSMLDLSRLEAEQLSVERKEISVSDLIEEVKSESQVLYENSGLNFIWKVEPGLPIVRTDPTKLKVILKNLISNAVKFTEKGSVTVNVYSHDGGIEFSVIDTGIGITPEMLPLIFESFRQLESPLTRRHGGVGLGLYIAKKLLELLGGSINVESEVGRGSTFSVWIPAGEGRNYGRKI